MKNYLTQIISATICAGLLAVATNASAVTLGINDDLYLGSFSPSQPAGDATERANVQNLIHLFNGSASYNATLNGRTFVSTSDGSSIPTPAPGVPNNGTQEDAGNQFTFDVTGYEYILGKYANEVAHVWYVAGLTSVTLPDLGQGLGLSHGTKFNATTTRVPDSGATFALAGLGMLAIAGLRRKLKN